MYAVIMAGGGGTRLWPLSRDRQPKPFLPLLEGGRCLLAATVDRLSPLIAPADVYVITDVRHAGLVRSVAPAIPLANVIGEPVGRNTAAAVALAAEAIDRPDDEVMVVLPADQAIRDEGTFRAALAAAAERARDGDLVTLGIEPSEPATGYGYVIASGEAVVRGGRSTYRVARFEEKPDRARAEALIEGGAASWNAGIFVWGRAVVRDSLTEHAPDIVTPIRDRLAELGRAAAGAGDAAPRAGDAGGGAGDAAGGAGDAAGGADVSTVAGWPGAAMAEAYADLRATSIDYALLEPASLAGRVAVVPVSMGWSDLGSWAALQEQRGSDGSPVLDATEPARIIDVGSRDILVQAAGGRLVAVVGLQGVVVVDTPDALLVTSTDAAQDVRAVVERLRAEGRSDLL